MSYLEENAYNAMVNIFSTISKDEKYYLNGYFASDMMKVNGQNCVYPCFLGFSSTSIVIVKVNSELEKEDIHFINSSNLKNIKIRKRFLSKIINITIQCKDNTSFTIAAPHALKYMPKQHESIDGFLKIYKSEWE
jgi:hypothetical protein